MSIKDILLHLDDSPACEHRIDVALNLALTQGSAVTGLNVVTFDYYQPHYLHAEEKTAAVASMLEVKARAAGVTVNCRSIVSSVAGVGIRELLIRNSHCSDLVVVSQESRRTVRSSTVVEHLIMGCGRPVLVVPATGSFPAIGRRVLVAWKNGREATRALHDVLPILQRADLVTLLAVSSAEESSQSAWEGVLEHLQCHGIQAQTELQPVTSATLADILLNQVSEGGHDLLVMGAFQPGSRRSSQLGAAAAQILREMTIPVVMSH